MDNTDEMIKKCASAIATMHLVMHSIAEEVARTVLDASGLLNQWMAISEAPRDGQNVLLTDGESVLQASWWVNEWMIHIGDDNHSHVTWLSQCYSPTHFMSLPQPPEKNNAD